ncbi:flavin reductase [Verticiella sediminum]|uniref:Flavin reductase n=2 Tax=Verticiella sediminum TaxID=1247510 RepID=A0A556AW46_9BURK|nr:flavin reductase [Verticiella sediminum]
MLGGAVTLITTDGKAGRAGFTASAVCSVTDSPPTILVCMNRSSYSNAFFRDNGVLCVNVLAPRHHVLSGRFANPGIALEERFANADWSRLATGAPALDHALVNLDCVIADTHEVGSHDICYCRVQAIRVSPDDEGLVYFNRAYHRLGAGSRVV